MNSWLRRDERESSVDLSADRLAYLVLAFGVLVAVAYRSFVHGEASWDLLALIVASGVAGLGYRALERVVTPRWLALRLATVGLGAAAAVILVLGLAGR